MSVSVTNLLQGPGILYHGIFGVTEPSTVDAEPGTGWVNLGATQEGLTLTVELELSELTADQIIDKAGAVVIGRTVKMATTLAEATLDNFAIVLNEPKPAIADEAGDRFFEQTGGLDAFTPGYSALLFDGRAPGGKRRRVILRRALSTDGVETAAKKDSQTVFPAVWEGYYVSESIRSFRMIDATT